MPETEKLYDQNEKGNLQTRNEIQVLIEKTPYV